MGKRTLKKLCLNLASFSLKLRPKWFFRRIFEIWLHCWIPFGLRFPKWYIILVLASKNFWPPLASIYQLKMFLSWCTLFKSPDQKLYNYGGHFSIGLQKFWPLLASISQLKMFLSWCTLFKSPDQKLYNYGGHFSIGLKKFDLHWPPYPNSKCSFHDVPCLKAQTKSYTTMEVISRIDGATGLASFSPLIIFDPNSLFLGFGVNFDGKTVLGFGSGFKCLFFGFGGVLEG